jgi:tetratricopeptide (TPR) repeat protein
MSTVTDNEANSKTMKKTRSLISTLWLLAVVAGVSADEKPPLDTLFEEAKLQEEKEKNFAEAIRLYGQVLARRAEDEEMAVNAQLRIANCFEQLGEFDRANAAYDQLLQNFDIAPELRQEIEGRQKNLRERRETKPAVRKPGMVRVDGVPALRWRPEDRCSLVGSIRAALVPLGERIPLADLMAVSGAAFDIHFYPWNLSSGRAKVSLFAEDALLYTGRTSHWLPAYNEEAKGKILGSLGSGVPVVAEGVVESGEFGVLAGYNPESKKWYGRTYTDAAETIRGYQILPRAGRGFLLIGEKAGTSLSEQQLLDRALVRAVYLMEMEESGTPHLHGFTALRWWAEALRADSAFENTEREAEISDILRANETTVAAYCSARANAAGFLNAHLQSMPPEEVEHARAAADAYEQAGRIVLARGYRPFGEGHSDPEIAKKSMRDRISRHQMAGLLDLAIAKEKEGVDHLKAILSLRRERILESCRSQTENAPQGSRAWRQLAEAEYVFGEYARAANSFGRCAELASAGNEKALAHLAAAVCLYEDRKREKAIDALLGIPSLLEEKNDAMIRALDRRLSQWEATTKTFHRFFDAVDTYVEQTGCEPYSCRLLIARRKWILGDLKGAQELYKVLTSAPLDWVAKEAAKALRDMKAGVAPVDQLPS